MQFTESGLLYNRIYRATVLAHLPDGKLKLYIYGVTPFDISAYKDDETLIEDLPMAEPAMSLFGGTGTTNGFISYPHIDATVWCFFENADYMKPIYFATVPAGVDYTSTYNSLSAHENIQHKLVVKNNIIDFHENGNVTLYVNDENNDANATVIDILPTKTSIKITDGSDTSTIDIIPGNKTSTIKQVVLNGNLEVNGNVVINGNEDITGTETVGVDSIIGGISFIGHMHAGNLGAPTSPPF